MLIWQIIQEYGQVPYFILKW